MVFFNSIISPRTSAVTFLLRSPSATAPITRCISIVGRTRSSMRLFTESTVDFHPPVDPVSTSRCESWPCSPTTWLTRANSVRKSWLETIRSLSPSATLPATPVHSSGMRAVKSPSRSRANTLRSAPTSTVSARVAGESGMKPPREGRRCLGKTDIVLVNPFDPGGSKLNVLFARVAAAIRAGRELPAPDPRSAPARRCR